MNMPTIDNLLVGSGLSVVIVTAVWVFWCMMTPGDYFANGSKAVIPSLFVGGTIGFSVGLIGKADKLKWIVAALFVGALCYWFLVPDGWWVTSPPRS